MNVGDVYKANRKSFKGVPKAKALYHIAAAVSQPNACDLATGELDKWYANIRVPDIELRPLGDYDVILVGFSGGKDSVACVLYLWEQLTELGIDPRSVLELWHHSVDGGPGDVQRAVAKAGKTAAQVGNKAYTRWLKGPGKDLEFLFDWPVTEDYCRRFAEALDIPIRFQWREGGIVTEMLKQNERTTGVAFETAPGGPVQVTGGKAGKIASRVRYPALGKLAVGRWCSSLFKIDVSRSAIANDVRFKGQGTVLMVTGERRQESDGRATYASVERHPSTTKNRFVDQWRPVLNCSEQYVWELMKKHGIVPHPAYYVGFSRTSCATCIFCHGKEWEALSKVLPEQVKFHRGLEQVTEAFQVARTEKLASPTVHGTIKKDLDIDGQRAQAETEGKRLVGARGAAALAADDVYRGEILVSAAQWKLPPGAYQDGPGPT